MHTRFRQPSLKLTIIGIVLVLFVSSFWLLTVSIGKSLERDMSGLLEAQQFSSVSYIAADIEAKVAQRIDLLNQNADLVAASAAASEALQKRAQTLVRAVQIFRLTGPRG